MNKNTHLSVEAFYYLLICSENREISLNIIFSNQDYED